MINVFHADNAADSVARMGSAMVSDGGGSTEDIEITLEQSPYYDP